MQGLVITKPIQEINDRAIEEGLLIIQAQGNVIRFVPPLIIEKSDVDEMVKRLEAVIEKQLQLNDIGPAMTPSCFHIYENRNKIWQKCMNNELHSSENTTK